MRYCRLWRQFAVSAFVREAEYRGRFWTTALGALFQLPLDVLRFVLLYRFTDSVAGWTREEALVLVGVYWTVEGLIHLQIAPNVTAIPGAIRSGTMDFDLLRPVSSQFLVSTRHLALPQAFSALLGVGVTAYALRAAGIGYSAQSVLLAAALLVCGLVLLYAVWFASVTLAFWLVDVSPIDELFYGFFRAAQFPVGYFKGAVRTFFTFVFPVAFATTFPSEALLGAFDPRWLVVAVALAAGALVATNRFWTFAVRHYTSASS